MPQKSHRRRIRWQETVGLALVLLKLIIDARSSRALSKYESQGIKDRKRILAILQQWPPPPARTPPVAWYHHAVFRDLLIALAAGIVAVALTARLDDARVERELAQGWRTTFAAASKFEDVDLADSKLEKSYLALIHR
jgi:hypothetical protein